MATLCHFPSFPSLSLSSDRHRRLQPKLSWYTLNPPHRRFRFRAYSIKKSRKVKSNAELCDEIREFVATIGLPEGRLPTMKEFSLHGRSDLAYIVRRRGYKRIEELLGITKETDLDGSNVEKVVSEDKDEEPNVVVGDFPSSFEVSVVGDCSSSLDMDSEVKSDNENHAPVEASANSSLQETTLYNLEGHNENGFNVDEDRSLETEVSITEYHISPTLDSGNHSQRPLENSTNMSLWEKGVTGGGEMVNVAIKSADDLLVEGETREMDSNGEDEVVTIAIESSDDLLVEGEILQNFQSEDGNVAKEDTSSAEVFIAENDSRSLNIDSALISDEDGSVPVELSALSLEERVANFMQYGHLDTVEEAQFATYTSGHLEKMQNGANGSTSNESAGKSLQLDPAAMGNRPFRDDDLSAEGESSQFNKNLDVQSSKRENQVEIGHLKFMLHQKELELFRLKEHIEKEKHDLSVLQAKAESEISKVQKLISEKEAELHAAEETLSGLVEVHIEYHGDGEIVEVAGSFNGWHHWIKMDPQPSSITDSSGSRS
ncbi:hypothetical protein TIFTF001_008458 [Ficus carica]|uniref:AMP-activated protein kinase glycogen-binding domain-containing protein n=1 Tax=Ficus carica TaxID=3494 RepID=A0AA87ZS75_FICCA|nr:hypothetical protein TIFTF001_008458 [Ficus carica]